jgi:hypothetical protein
MALGETVSTKRSRLAQPKQVVSSGERKYSPRRRRGRREISSCLLGCRMECRIECRIQSARDAVARREPKNSILLRLRAFLPLRSPRLCGEFLFPVEQLLENSVNTQQMTSFGLTFPNVVN